MWSILKLIFWIFVLVLALSFFGISIQAIVTSPAGQANFAYVYQLMLEAWHWLILRTDTVINTLRLQ